MIGHEAIVKYMNLVGLCIFFEQYLELIKVGWLVKEVFFVNASTDPTVDTCGAYAAFFSGQDNIPLNINLMPPCGTASGMWCKI